ncbi:MAG: MFS transporter, partial [Archaeoglobaceae archaeon]
MKLLLTLGFILITFASQSIWVTFSPVLSNVAEELGVQTALVGYLAVLYPLFFLILTIPSGILLDRNFRFWLTFGSVATFLGGTLRLLMPYS